MTLYEILEGIANSGTGEARIDVVNSDGAVMTVRVIVAKIVNPDGTVAFDMLPEDGRDVGKPLQ